jgi:DNA (cytosine-5)-methyltransferase 1
VDSTEKYTDEQRIISICYGYGGLERGVSEIIPIRPVAYVEIEAFQCFNLVSAMEAGLVDPAPVWTDVKTFDGNPFCGKVHGIIGGYPCQGESFAGKRQLWNDERFLYPHIERIIGAVRPVWCFFENVEGHLSGTFPYVLDSLQKMGYNVEAGIFSAEEAGAPHKRKRLFILAVMGNSSGIISKWSHVGTKIGKVKTRRTGKKLSHTDCFGSTEGMQKSESGKFNKNGSKWPAGRGEKQFEWEAPRTTESGMGCTVNGYNFRTELLRQYGNGVVSQTAAIAFENLMKKLTT